MDHALKFQLLSENTLQRLQTLPKIENNAKREVRTCHIIHTKIRYKDYSIHEKHVRKTLNCTKLGKDKGQYALKIKSHCEECQKY